MDIRIDLRGDGIKGILVYANDSHEREEGLQTLLNISPELKRIDEKLVASRKRANSGQ
jgi:hypothetical protein